MKWRFYFSTDINEIEFKIRTIFLLVDCQKELKHNVMNKFISCMLVQVWSLKKNYNLSKVFPRKTSF